VQVIGASRLIYQLVVLVALGIFHFSLMGIHMIYMTEPVSYITNIGERGVKNWWIVSVLVAISWYQYCLLQLILVAEYWIYISVTCDSFV